jgi:hypothetical protein
MLDKDKLIFEIREAAKRSAWRRVLSAVNEDADSIIADPELLRLIWSEQDAKIMESWAEHREQGTVTSEENQAAMDRGIIPFSEFIDVFFKEKDKALRDLENYDYE